MLVETNHCVLNGDPNNEAGQRINDNGYGYVTDVCIARLIKNYLAYKGKELAIDGVKTGEDFKGMTEKVALERFIDLRLFGAMLKTPGKKGEKTDISVARCVNTTMAETTQPIIPQKDSITRMMEATKGKEKNSTMGTQNFVEHATFAINMVVSGRQAEKNGVTKEDLDLLFEAMKNWPKVLEGPRAGRVEVIHLEITECEDNLVPSHMNTQWAWQAKLANLYALGSERCRDNEKART